MSGDNTVDIHAKVNVDGVDKGIDDIHTQFASLKEGIEGLKEDSDSLAADGVGLAKMAAIAGVVAAGITATAAALYSCVSAAAALEEQWGFVEQEDLLSTKVASLGEAYAELKTSIGEEFLPGVKDAVSWMTYLVDKMKEGIDYAKDHKFGLRDDSIFGTQDYSAPGSLQGMSEGGAPKSTAQLERERIQKEAQELRDEELLNKQMDAGQKRLDSEKHRVDMEIHNGQERLDRENARFEQQQNAAEQRLGEQNRRTLENKEKEELREMERALSVNEKFAGGGGARGIHFAKDDAGGGFASSAEDVFRKISAGAASGDDERQAREQAEATRKEIVAQQTETNRIMADSNVINGKILTAVEAGGGLA
jgi:hypothetical protein